MEMFPHFIGDGDIGWEWEWVYGIWHLAMGSDQPQSFPFDNASFDHAAMAVAAFFN